jgi:hypothetical protein
MYFALVTCFPPGGNLCLPSLVVPLLLGIWTDILFFFLECTPPFKENKSNNTTLQLALYPSINVF